MRRFWDEAEAAAAPGGFQVLLDGRPMRLPGGAVLIVGAPLAEALADEWRQAGGAKGGEMDYAAVPLTRLAGTARERVAPDPAASVRALAAYGESDLLCYRAEEPRLAAREAAAWQPWLDWAATAHGARLAVTHGIAPVAQPPQALDRLRQALTAQSVDRLAALGIAVPALGSLVLGLALAEGALSAEAAHRLAILDETFQLERWGDDPEAAARRAGIADDIALAARYIGLTS